MIRQKEMESPAGRAPNHVDSHQCYSCLYPLFLHSLCPPSPPLTILCLLFLFLHSLTSFPYLFLSLFLSLMPSPLLFLSSFSLFLLFASFPLYFFSLFLHSFPSFLSSSTKFFFLRYRKNLLQ